MAAGVWFRGWAADAPEHTAAAVVPDAADYAPGEFARRELPGLLAVLALGPAPDVVLVDGFVWLGPGRPGLGAKLFAALGGPAVVGVAKTRFSGADAVEVVRNRAKPLLVTAAGLDPHEAAAGVRGMHGPFRVPTLLRVVDRLARTAHGESG